MIIAIDHREFDRGITQGMSCLQSAKSCANYHHAWHFRWDFALLSFDFILCAHLYIHENFRLWITAAFWRLTNAICKFFLRVPPAAARGGKGIGDTPNPVRGGSP